MTPHDSGAAAPRRTASLLRVVAPFAAGYWVSYLFRTVNAVIAPELTGALALGPGDLGLLTSTYFLTFALAQIPVGIAIDRWGPRRVVSALLLVAAAGAAIFAGGAGFSALAVGRALIGIGVSACLMGALKAMSAAFPAGQHASLTGLIMAAGAFGALTTSLPLAWVLPYVGWPGALLATAVISVALAALIFLAVPRAVAPGTGARAQHAQVRVLLVIARRPSFWRFAAQAGLYTGGFMALQGLWAGPFLVTVAGQTRAGAAATLLVLNLGLLAGQLFIGAAATRLARAGLDRARLMSGGLGFALAAWAVILLWPRSGPLPWFLFGVGTAASAQVYGLAAAEFHDELSGRVSTAVNLFAFVGAFAAQWGIGAAVEALGTRVDAAAAFRLALGALWVLQAASVLWSARRSPAPPAV